MISHALLHVSNLLGPALIGTVTLRKQEWRVDQNAQHHQGSRAFTRIHFRRKSHAHIHAHTLAAV